MIRSKISTPDFLIYSMHCSLSYNILNLYDNYNFEVIMLSIRLANQYQALPALGVNEIDVIQFALPALVNGHFSHSIL